jgi:hypothetical protein
MVSRMIAAAGASKRAGVYWHLAWALLLTGLCGPAHLLAQASAPAAGTKPGDAVMTTQASTPRLLHAGPIAVKLEDGELRYLYVGQKEIVRRVYFAVRDGQWNTAMPKFTSMTVDDGGDHFIVALSATCKSDKVDYQWQGIITGSADGKITFEATGIPNVDFASNRIGLCVLFGAPSLKGQAFQTLDESKKPLKQTQFPQLVLDHLVAERFQTLGYTTADGLAVSCTVSGATFDMEDQRNWGDSSFKAYAPLRYKYPNVKKADKQRQTITITAANAPATPAIEAGPIHLKLTDTVIGKLPKFVASTQFRNAVAFQDISFARQRFNGAKVVIWLYTPTVHLPDNDVIMENVSAICDQAKTVKSFAPEASLHVGAALRATKAGAGQDPRAPSPFAAAWATALLKYLSCGGIEEAGFDLGPGYVTQVVDAMRPLAGKDVLDVQVAPHEALHPTAYAVKDGAATFVWVANRKPRAVQILLEGISGTSAAKVTHIDGGGKVDVAPTEQQAEVRDGNVLINLPPYGVARVTLSR